MALVQLPPGCLAACRAAAGDGCTLGSAGGGGASPTIATSADAKYVQDVLHHRHAVECPIKCIAGHLYARISGAALAGAACPSLSSLARPASRPVASFPWFSGSPVWSFEQTRRLTRPRLCILPCAVHIYNEMADYKRLAAAVLHIAGQQAAERSSG